jgi:hypothetical protein
MAFKKTEKDILKAIVKYGEGEHSMAKVLNKSKLLEKNGIVIAFGSNRNYVFYDKNKYDWEDGNALSYVSELISLIKHLIDNRLITILPDNVRYTHVIGRQNSRLAKMYHIEVDDAFLEVESNMGNWIDKRTNEQTYWPNCFSEQEIPISQYLECSFSISQELRDLVKNDFKSEEQIRFQKQQRLQWVSIFVTGIIGLAGLVLAIIGLIR